MALPEGWTTRLLVQVPALRLRVIRSKCGAEQATLRNSILAPITPRMRGLYLTSYGAPYMPSFSKRDITSYLDPSVSSQYPHHGISLIAWTLARMDNRAIRLPPNTRRNLFAAHTAHQQPQQQPTSRRQNHNAPAIRPDSREIQPDIFTQPVEDELVEKDVQGDYIVHAPIPVYKNMSTVGLGPEGDEETGES